ncbi:MAG: M56 family metallopeptidase [Clostridia bacterium]|nr:M56 family metallopeptidase [Clostridia bacterium]
MQILQILFSNILYMAGMASFVAIVVLVLRKIFDQKISPKWKLTMWILLLISLILPFRFTLYANNHNFYTVSTMIDKIDDVKNALATSSLGRILTILWLSGILVLGIFYFISSWRMKIKIGKEEIKEERILKIWEQAKEEIGVKKKIKLIKQNTKITPCIYGILHPKILLTEEILEKPEEVLKHVFMHELSHEKRKDVLVNKILLLITIAYWFNPFFWFCFQQIRQDMELKADELVLSKLPKQKEKEYAKSLVSILPISQEEKMTSRLLYVTDGKKNMERRIKMIKLSKQFKEYKTLIGVTTLVLTLCIGILIFTQIKPKQEEETFNTIKYFETPDRIVYKIKGEDKYYVYTSAKNDYDVLLNQLIKCVDGVGEGAKLSQEDMKKIEEEENYIELDYDTISKNYVISYQKENYNVIKRTDEGGIVVKNNIKQRETLEKLLAEQIREKKECYEMLDNKEYRLLEPISYEVPSWSNELKKYEQGIYSVRLGTKDAWERFKENNHIVMSQDIPEEQFEKTNVMATITRYQIDKIETRIGGATLYFKGAEQKDKYYVNLYCISKAVNINCIYRNFNAIIQETIEVQQSENAVNTLNKTSNNTNIKNENPISEERAKQIAIEALKEDGITTYESIKIERKTENKYYLQKWTDTNQNYAEKYTPVNDYEAVDTWYVAFQDAGDVGCYVGIWIDVYTSEILCYHWTGE